MYNGTFLSIELDSVPTAVCIPRSTMAVSKDGCGAIIMLNSGNNELAIA